MVTLQESFWIAEAGFLQVGWQDGHKPGKPGILGDFSEHGKARKFSGICATSGKNCNKVF